MGFAGFVGRFILEFSFEIDFRSYKFVERRQVFLHYFSYSS